MENQIFSSLNNQNEIPSSLYNSMNENKNEFSEQFLNHLLDYKNTILQNSIENNNGTPKKIINKEIFYENYINELISKNTMPNRNKFLFQYEQSEIRIIKLIENLSLSNMKYSYYLERPDQKIQKTNSELIKVNEIIKNSPTLISYIYILKWIQNIKENYFNYLSLEKNNLRDKEQFDLNGKINFQEKGFDQLNQTQNEKDINYINFINQITCLIMSNDLYNTQNKIDERKQYYLSSILEGGLPLHDFSLEAIDLQKFDIDLIPLYMKNLEFNEFIIKTKNNPILINLEDYVIGNNNWVLWLYTLFDSCNDKTIHTQFNLLSRLLSGNFNNYNINSQNFDEFLFIKIMNLLNCELLETMFKKNDDKYINYHFNSYDKENVNYLISSRNGKTIFDVIHEIRSSEEYNFLIQKNFSVELELSIIELHFLQIENKYNNNNNNKIYESILNFLNRLNNQIEKDNFPIYFNNNKQEIKINTLEEKNRKTSSIIKLLKITYLKILFSFLISFHDLFSDYFKQDLNPNYLNELQNSYDNILGQFFNYLTKITREPSNLIYIFTYMLNFNNIIYYLSNYAKTIEFESYYPNFINEINAFFKNEKQYLHKSIAEETDLFKFKNNEKKTIDFAINEYVQNKLSGKSYNPSKENLIKINQINNLFKEQEDLNGDLNQQYHLKLCVKFISNQCYHEAKEILQKIMTREKLTENQRIANFDYETNKIYDKISDRINNKEFIEYQYKDIIKLSINLMQMIIDCFFDYCQIEYEITKVGGGNQIESFKERIYRLIEMKLISLNTFIKSIINDNELINYYSTFYGPVIFTQNFLKILFDWGFQSIKLIVYCFTKRFVLIENKYIIRKIQYENGIAKYIYSNNNDTNEFFLLALPTLNNIEQLYGQDFGFYNYLNNNYTLEIYQLLYSIAKINKEYLSSIFTNELQDTLKKMKKEDIEQLDFSI